MSFRAKGAFLFLLAGLVTSKAHAVPWPIGVSTQVPSIEATFGQYRKVVISECPGGVACSHFQRGLSLDPTPTGAGSSVSAVRAGSVLQINAGIPFISVTGGGRVITYRYVTADPLLNPGSPISVGQTLGTMSGSYVDVEGSYDNISWCNPLYCLGSTFTNYYPVPNTVHPTISDPSLIDANTFAPISISTPIGNRQFHIIADILGSANAPSSPSVGVDQVGFYIEPVSIDTGTSISGLSYKFGPWLRQTYDRVRFASLLTPGTAYYLKDSAEGGPFYYIATNGVETPSLASNVFQDGEWQACVIAKGALETNFTTNCSPVTFERTAPTPTLESGGASFTYATSTPIVTVSGFDKHGMYSITIAGPSGNGTAYASGFQTTLSTTTGVLTDGQYTATVVDLAGNASAPLNFIVRTSGANQSASSASGNSQGSSSAVSTCTVITANDPAGIAELSISSPGFSASATYDCSQFTVSFGPFCNLAVDTYTVTVLDCAGNTSVSSRTKTAPDYDASFCGTATLDGSHKCARIGGFDVDSLNNGQGFVYVDSSCGANSSNITTLCLQMKSDITSNCRIYNTGSCYIARSDYTGGAWQPGQSFSVVNMTTMTPSLDLHVTVGINTTSNSIGFGGGELDPTDSVTFVLTVPEVGQSSFPVNAGAFASTTPFAGPSASAWTPTASAMAASGKTGLASVPANGITQVSGSDDVFYTSATLGYKFSASGNGIAIDTSTLAIYRWTGVAWDSSSITSQYISSATGVITATGTYTRTGIFGLFFRVVDSSAPATAISFPALSSFTFNGTFFVSTDAYAQLTAADPIVGGYASGVATTYYRLDATTSTTAYSIYDSSFPLSLGLHKLEYYSSDWAGNAEAVNISTFLVTAGAQLHESGSVLVPGNFLAGFLSYGYGADIQSAAQWSNTLAVSSPNASGMLDANNIGAVGLSNISPQAHFDSQGFANTAETNLSLKSGNSSGTTTSAQILFGFNGDASMRDAFVTQHSSSVYGNRLDLLVWNPGAGSTSTVANLDVVALQAIMAGSGSSMHVHPFGVPDVELEISDGSSTGGGTLHRFAAITPSSRMIKSDISYLSDKQERQALADVLSLKPASFRFKNSPVAQKGLIFEDTPASDRGPGTSIMLTDRITNLEMALKQEMERYEALQKRLSALELEEGKK